MDELLVVVGPTASGKTALAVRLAEALAGEIVSADSVQIYRGFDLGSGKPTAHERLRAPHHLIDVADPDQPMDAARFVELADAALAEIRARGKRAIVCGGTFLWVRSLLHGLAQAPPADPELRARHAARAERDGRAALHAELLRVDPVSARRLNPNDLVRVSRALEVHELSGVPLSEWQARHGFLPARYPARLIGIRHPPEVLDRRIRQRVEAMLDAGWIEEVRGLLAAGHAGTRPMGSVGYKQVAQALASGATPEREPLVDAITRATRIFARRQRTWLRDRGVDWLTDEAANRAGPELVARVLRSVAEPE